MTADLAAESARIQRELGRIMRQAPIESEAPLRMTIRDVDAGGAPELSPALVRWIGQVCWCGRDKVCAAGCRATRPDEHLAACEPACRNDVRFHASTHRNNPNRMKKALRQVRKLNPKAYDFVYLIVAHHMTFDQAAAKINADNISRGQRERTDAEFAVMWVSGASMLGAAF
jgi:hypothetical protein